VGVALRLTFNNALQASADILPLVQNTDDFQLTGRVFEIDHMHTSKAFQVTRRGSTAAPRLHLLADEAHKVIPSDTDVLRGIAASSEQSNRHQK
jgi:hypothetical protein